MQWLKIAISNLVHTFGLPIRPIIKSHKIDDKNRPLYGSATKFGVPFFAMAEVAMAVPNKRYYIKMANINVKNKIYIQMLKTHTSKTAKIGTEFSCGARRHCDDVLYNQIHSSNFCCFRCVSL